MLNSLPVLNTLTSHKIVVFFLNCCACGVTLSGASKELYWWLHGCFLSDIGVGCMGCAMCEWDSCMGILWLVSCPFFVCFDYIHTEIRYIHSTAQWRLPQSCGCVQIIFRYPNRPYFMLTWLGIIKTKATIFCPPPPSAPPNAAWIRKISLIHAKR